MAAELRAEELGPLCMMLRALEVFASILRLCSRRTEHIFREKSQPLQLYGIETKKLPGWVAWFMCHLVRQNVAGSVLGQGTYYVSMFLSLSPSLVSSLSKIK